MVCNRCIIVVQNELDKLGFRVEDIRLGEIMFNKELTSQEKNKLDVVLSQVGFELIDDRRSLLIEKIKNVIIDLVHVQDDEPRLNVSDILSEKLQQDYSYISN